MTDVERLTSVPVVAEISTNKQKAKGSAIVVRENKNDIMEETFRGLRTNMLFMLDPKQKVILVSSSMPGEGKSFVAGNLATSLAFLGKKVVVVGLDINREGLEGCVSNLAGEILEEYSAPINCASKEELLQSIISFASHVVKGNNNKNILSGNEK
jgi:signal recognition particle GTPase